MSFSIPVILNTHIDLAAGIVREIGVDDSLIQSQLPSVRGYLQHIVLFGLYGTAVNLGGSFR